MDHLQPKHFVPKDWDDDMKMTVMFSPFRDKNLNPKSWDQKIKFWSDVILQDCMQSKTSIIDSALLKEKFKRKGKSPSCFNTVIEEMVRKGLIKKLSDIESGNTEGWLSWGYNRLVKKPIGWSMKWLSGQQEETKNDMLVVIDVIKDKAKQMMEIQSSRLQTDTVNIVEYDKLHESFKEICPTEVEFSLVMKELVETKQAVVQISDDKTKLVKFTVNDKKKKVETINEQDIHIHRIQKAQAECTRQIEILSSEVERLGSEAVAYKQKGMTKLAMSNMRKRKLAINRIDKLTGSMETLEELMHRIKQAESNEMIVKAIEGGTSVLRDLSSKTTVDDVSNMMDNLADVTQTQEEIMSELNTTGFIDEPSQSELEEELSDILSQNTPTRKSTARSGDDSDIERELNEILNDSNADVGISGADSYKDEGLSELLADLQLPDVPSHSPNETRRKLLTS